MLYALERKMSRALRVMLHGPFYEVRFSWRGWVVLYHARYEFNQRKFGPTWSKKACRAYIAIMESVT